MANAEQLAILRQGAEVWNKWRVENPNVKIDLFQGDLANATLSKANLRGVSLVGVDLNGAYLVEADLRGAELSGAYLIEADLRGVDLSEAHLTRAYLQAAVLLGAHFRRCNWIGATISSVIFANSDLSTAIGLEDVAHFSPSSISTSTFAFSKGKIPGRFLRGCGLSDWEIEAVKLYNPDLTNEERNQILYKIYDLQSTQAIQISPLFISYSHKDSKFVDKIGDCLQEKGIRYWRDTHEMKAGRIETQIDRSIRQNPTVLLVLSEHSLSSDWVEHEVRTARLLEKDMGRDVLCPVALDESWKSSPWPKRIMEQIMEYNILDFSEWKDDPKFDDMFRKLIDGLELFYKG